MSGIVFLVLITTFGQHHLIMHFNYDVERKQHKNKEYEAHTADELNIMAHALFYGWSSFSGVL